MPFTTEDRDRIETEKESQKANPIVIYIIIVLISVLCIMGALFFLAALLSQ